jgi:hypothetical protein
MEYLHPEKLMDFFEGRLSQAGLGRQFQLAISPDLQFGTNALSDDLKEDFVVTADHLVELCDAVLDGGLEPCQLETIASVLVSFERFTWNGSNHPNDPINKVIHAWEMPDLNYCLTKETVMKCRTLLRTGENNFDEDDREEILDKDSSEQRKRKGDDHRRKRT